MPGLLDGVMLPLAENLIESFGGAITYTQTSETFSATTGKTTVMETNHSVIMTPPAPYNVNRIDGSVVQVGDLEAMLKAQNLGFVPAAGDKVTFNGTDWQVVGVKPLFSGALAAAYTIQLRQ